MIKTAKDILKEKGYVKNKFDTNGFINLVAEMFNSLPIEGSVTLVRVRFVEKPFPLTKEEYAQGYYYLTESYEKIQNQYEALRALYVKLQEESDGANEKLESTEDEIVDKVVKQIDILYQNTRKEALNKNTFRTNGALLKGIEKIIGNINIDSVIPKEHESVMVAITKKVQSNTWNLSDKVITPELAYFLLHKYKNADKLIARMTKRSNECIKLQKLYDEKQKELDEFETNKRPYIQLSRNTVYIDEPFFKNAAAVLRTMCGYVVERKVRKGNPYYNVKLI